MLRRSIRFGTVRLSLERADGDLTSEQEKQVGFIRKGADTLLELVNDLLDLAKIEAGKVEVQPVDFEVANFFSALRVCYARCCSVEAFAWCLRNPAGFLNCIYR